MSTKNTDIATTQDGETVPAPQVDPYAAYGAASATGRPFIKYDRGVYKFGPVDESEIVPTGTLVVANMSEMMVGWLKWADGQFRIRLRDTTVKKKREMNPAMVRKKELGNSALRLKKYMTACPVFSGR